MRHAALIAMVGAALAACSGPSGEFDTTLSTKQLMKHVIDPAAIALWGRAGTIETAAGTEYLTPTTEADWDAAENEAAIVAEAGNLLILPGRVRKLSGVDGDWTIFARRLTREALAVKNATAARDADDMFKSGADLYQVCVACHEKYYVPFIKEGDEPPENAPPTKPK